MAGLGESCTYVSALLFAVEAALPMRKNKTVTQEKQNWLVLGATKKGLYWSVSKIDFSSPNFKKKQLDEKVC